MKLIQLLRDLDPEQPAVVQAGKIITVGALLQESQQFAAGFRKIGLRAGDTAVIAAKPDAGFVCLVYAALQAGIRLAVIDPEMGRDNYREKLQQLQASWAFVDSRLLLLQEHPILRWIYFQVSRKGIYFPRQKGLKIIATGPWMPLFQKHINVENLKGESGRFEAPELSDDAAFLITYTSGTTTVPKGVLHTVGAITASILHIANLIKGPKNRRLATHLPYFAIIAVNAGVEAHLWAYRMPAKAQIQFIEKHDISILFSPPCDYLPMIEYCEKEGCILPDCLQLLCFGSAPVHRSFLERMIAVLPDHVSLTCLYGMTENLVVASIDGREKATLPTDQGDILGKPVSGVQIKIAADGEILLRSDQTYARYLHMETREAWHASGDLGFINDAGYLVLTGRKKDMIIRRNFNLYPGLYEPTINRIPGVTECAFVGVFVEHQQDEVVALFVETHGEISAKSLRRELEYGPYSIDREALPDRIIFGKLPRSGRQNKVDKQALRKNLEVLIHG